MPNPFTDPDRLIYAVGIEDTFIPQEFVGRRKLDEYEMTQHTHYWHSDLGLAAESGAQAIRWGIPWYRVNPEKNRWDFAWLDRVAERMQQLDLEPIIDLMHYGTPLWLSKSFDDADYPARVAEYAARVAERYRDVFTVFTPLNEPLLNVIYCGEFGVWPPHLTGDQGFARLLRQLGEGLVRTQSAIAEVTGARATFVHVEAAYRFAGDSPAHADEIAFLRDRAYIVEDLVTGRVTANHSLAEWLMSNGFPESALQWHQENTAVPDVMGVNYYPQVSTELFDDALPQAEGSLSNPRPRVNSGVEGLTDVLTAFWHRYGRPVMLTETSLGGTPAERIAWLDESVAAVHGLRERGVPIVGYTWWAVFDWFTWNYREEARPIEEYLNKHGLWDLELDAAGVFQRVRTEVVDRFQRHAAGELGGAR